MTDLARLPVVDIERGRAGVDISWANGRVALEGLRPAVVLSGSRTWAPSRFEAIGDAVVARDERRGLRVRLSAREVGHDQVDLRAVFTNDGPAPVRLERLVVGRSDGVRVGEDPRRWRTYRNGHQSWAGTATIGTNERDYDVPTRFGRATVTDARHRAPTAPGHIRSDWISAICEPTSGDALAASFTTTDVAFGFVELTGGAEGGPQLTIWADFDAIEVGPGQSTAELGVAVAAVSGHSSAGWRALGRVAEATGSAMGARSTDRPHPGGWCSWYYYFTKVTEADVIENLGVLAVDGRNGPRYGCEYMMIDDGHQRAIGDWLDTDTAKFPSGMAGLAQAIGDRGFDAGIWWAPFIVSSRSQVARAHPEWLVRTQRGRPMTALINPAWGVTTPMWALDTTHPGALDHISTTAATITEWGYGIQKLDFLFAASLPGVRHDSSATRAVALRRGLEAVRSGAGQSSFLLGCGCPFGPAIGVVDAMRIGADVSPYWSNVIDQTVGRGRHALATRNAVRNTLTRAVLDRAWWLNDPDCLMVRDSNTKLTLDEVRVLCTVFGMTNGMVVLSDRLEAVPADRRDLIARARALSGGQVEVVDLFERAFPELLVSRHGDRVDVALLNLDDGARPASIDLRRLGLVVPDGVELREDWTGRAVPVRDGLADLGLVKPHSAHVLIGLGFPGDSEVRPS